MKPDAALLDTSFFLRFLDSTHPLNANADDYFRYFVSSQISMYISTITLAEYCVLGNADHLPLTPLKILPFNSDHAIRAGTMAAHAFQARKAGHLQVGSRVIIPNDTKLFAHADVEPDIKYYLTSDTDSLKLYQNISGINPKFNFIDLNNPYQTFFGILI